MPTKPLPLARLLVGQRRCFCHGWRGGCCTVTPSGEPFFFACVRRRLRLPASPVVSTVATSTTSAGAFLGRCSGMVAALTAATAGDATSFLLARKALCADPHRGKVRTVTPQRPQLKQIKLERGCAYFAHPGRGSSS